MVTYPCWEGKGKLLNIEKMVRNVIVMSLRVRLLFGWVEGWIE
jgi:hypothetical protein